MPNLKVIIESFPEIYTIVQWHCLHTISYRMYFIANNAAISLKVHFQMLMGNCHSIRSPFPTIDPIPISTTLYNI